MTLTMLGSESYQKQANHDCAEQISVWKLPKIVWIAAGIFLLNLLVGTGFFVTSDTRAEVSAQQPTYSVSGKPSPFTETVDTSRHKVRVAAKLRPVSFVAAPIEGAQAPDMSSSLTPQPVAYSVTDSANKENKFVVMN
jgi:hypothetical protein